MNAPVVTDELWQHHLKGQLNTALRSCQTCDVVIEGLRAALLAAKDLQSKQMWIDSIEVVKTARGEFQRVATRIEKDYTGPDASPTEGEMLHSLIDEAIGWQIKQRFAKMMAEMQERNNARTEAQHKEMVVSAWTAHWLEVEIQKRQDEQPELSANGHDKEQIAI